MTAKMRNQPNFSENYILLPISKTRVSPQESPNVAKFFIQLQSSTSINLNLRKRPAQPSDEITVTVLDSIDTEGAKLISISKQELANFRFSYPGVMIIPEKFYSLSVASREMCYTPMTNFILKHKEATEPDMDKMNAVLDAHGIRVLDGSLLPQIALVEIEESSLAEVQTDLGTEWNIYPEKNYGMPEPRKKSKKAQFKYQKKLGLNLK